MLKLPGTKRLKQKCYEPLSNVAFKFMMRRYTMENLAFRVRIYHDDGAPANASDYDDADANSTDADDALPYDGRVSLYACGVHVHI